MKKLVVLAILLISAVLTPIFTLEGTALFDSAIENYKQKQNEIALEQLLEFRNLNPENRKEDDALWYIGRLYERLDRIEAAETAFREVLEIVGSNRLAEAAYDLSQILYSRKNYLEITDFLSHLMELDKPDSYEIRSLDILGDSLYSLGRSHRSEYRDEAAAVYFLKAAEAYEFLLSFQEDDADRSKTLYNLGKSYRRLATLGLSRAYYVDYYEKGINTLRESGLPAALTLLSKLENSRNLDLEIDTAVLGGLDNITTSFGSDLSADVSLIFPLGFNKELFMGISYEHDDFSFKTFNFDPLKTGDSRLIQSTDKISSDLVLKIGNSRNFLNTFKLDAVYRLAEDAGDNYYSVSFSENGDWRINSEWKTGWDSEFSWKVFPDYLVGGHKIDSIKADIKPYIKWYYSDKSELTLNYGLN
ncbi:MAG: tetratricopeptide repeat protein, partial [Spirochaetales bacterium]|nr:tetratricopeptide repeat protein [Spirochaetales bacterium]